MKIVTLSAIIAPVAALKTFEECRAHCKDHANPNEVLVNVICGEGTKYAEDSPCAKDSVEACEEAVDAFTRHNWNSEYNSKNQLLLGRRKVKDMTCNYKFETHFSETRMEQYACEDNCINQDNTFSKDDKHKYVFCNAACTEGNTKEKCATQVRNIWSGHWTTEFPDKESRYLFGKNVLCQWPSPNQEIFFHPRCMIRDCANWMCKEWCWCEEHMPWMVTFFDAGVANEYCPSDGKECNCDEEGPSGGGPTGTIEEIPLDIHKPWEWIDPLWDPLPYIEAIMPPITCGEWVPTKEEVDYLMTLFGDKMLSAKYVFAETRPSMVNYFTSFFLQDVKHFGAGSDALREHVFHSAYYPQSLEDGQFREFPECVKS